MTPDTLVLFDIDGTLLWAGGAGHAAMRAALLEVYGTTGPFDSISLAGRTDRGVVHELLAHEGLSEAAVDARFDDMATAMIRHLGERLTSGDYDVRPCPGTAELLADLAARPRVMLGLLTGNMAPTARLKLKTVQIDPDLFVVGAYGDDHAERPELARLAIERASARAGRRFEGRQVVVIGDTPADVLCGEAFGVWTVAVLTGRHSREALAAAGADAILPDLADTQAALRAILPG